MNGTTGVMTDGNNKALLPTGLGDALPPRAGFEAEVVGSLMADFAANGYLRVDPPLIEFEDSLLSGSGAALAGRTFRLMDPVSQRMLAVRSDMTLQVARIATNRLGAYPRPLRLSYAGQVLRTKGSHLRPDRQFAQAGVELIGSDSPAADAEVVLVTTEALKALGIAQVSVDLNLPTLVPAVCDALGLDAQTKDTLRAALDHKDAVAVNTLGGRVGELFGALIRAGGVADRAMAALDAIDLPEKAAAQRARLADVVARLKDGAPDLALTIDPVEHRGFEYHTGVSFSVFCRSSGGELGRGGRYEAGAAAEPAVGATLFLDMVCDAAPTIEPGQRVFVPYGTPRAQVTALRTQGHNVVAGLDPVDDLQAEAARLGCSQVFENGVVAAL